jgi:hypothetical protein
LNGKKNIIKHLGCVWIEGNGEKGRGEIWREEVSLVWIANWEGRDLEGRDLEGKVG